MEEQKISSADIAIVVQGSISKEYTPFCLLKLRNIFPKAELILSTQKGCDISECKFDKIVYSSDPGAVVQDEKLQILNNINRQLITTQAGLSLCTRKYILKIRTDLYLEDSRFLKYYFKYYQKPDHSKGLGSRILICSYYTRNPRILNTPFHPSDWIAFGLSEDMKAYYNIRMQSEEEGKWFKEHPKNEGLYKDYLCRYLPEQHLCINSMERFYPIKCSNYYDNNEENIALTERILAENFIVLTYGKELNIKFPKYNPNRYNDDRTLIHFKDWKVLYRKYIEGNAGMMWSSYCLKSMLWGKFYQCMYYKISRVLSILGVKQYIKKIRDQFIRS